MNPSYDPTYAVLGAVVYERERQRRKCEQMLVGGKPWYTCADPRMDDGRRLAVLGEEYGEVCRELCESSIGNGTPGRLREELIQLAAVAVAWVEYIDGVR